MKKKVLYNLVVVTLVIVSAFTACVGGSNSSGKIKMTTEAGNFRFKLTGSGTATVDWGDGSEKVMLTLREVGDIGFGIEFSHTYPNETIRTITINGDNITGFYIDFVGIATSLNVSRCTELTRLKIYGSPLTSLDVSKNTALETLICIAAQLTSLDVSKNTMLKTLTCASQLTSLDVSKNTVLTDLSVSGQLTANALNALFETLNSNAGKKTISIYNPGEIDCDRSIAERKGWTFR